MGFDLYSIQSEENAYDERVNGDDMFDAARYMGLFFRRISPYILKITFLKNRGEFIGD